MDKNTLEKVFDFDLIKERYEAKDFTEDNIVCFVVDGSHGKYIPNCLYKLLGIEQMNTESEDYWEEWVTNLDTINEILSNIEEEYSLYLDYNDFDGSLCLFIEEKELY